MRDGKSTEARSICEALEKVERVGVAWAFLGRRDRVYKLQEWLGYSFKVMRL